MAFTYVPQGILNRLRSTVSFASNPALNITPAYLAKAGLRLGFAGAVTVAIDSMTGVVTSPEPYLRFMLQVHLNMALGFADAWKQQIETNGILGDLTVRSPSTQLSPYQLVNGFIENVDELDFSGASADFPLRIGGTYPVNTLLWP